MKKVWSAGYKVFWACNGQEVVGLTSIEFTPEKCYLWRGGHYKLQVQLVGVPTNRCKNCGEKQ